MIHKAKKSLGQNFLKSEKILEKICKTGDIKKDDIILEIGPGKGSLTKKLLEKSGTVIAVEKDYELIEILKEKFFDEIKNKKLILVEGDILKFDIEKILNKKENYKIIANIPYNITGAIFKKFLSCNSQPSKMVLLVQKEVVERIIARDEKESILSLSIKIYGDPKYIMTVSKNFFTPKPKVDSGIILIDNISRKNFANQNQEKIFFELIKNGFAHKRKILKKNLKELIGDSSKIEKILEKLKIQQNIRAEDLDLEKWLEISKILSTEK